MLKVCRKSLKRFCAVLTAASVIPTAAAAQTEVSGALCTSRPIGSPEVITERYTVLGSMSNGGRPKSSFAQNGTVSYKIENGEWVIGIGASDTAQDMGLRIGPGDRNGKTDASFGLTNENRKNAVVKMDIKAENGTKLIGLSINFGYAPKADGSDYIYFGRRLERAADISAYTADSEEWQTVEVPLSVFKSERTNKYCIPGTDNWTYEIADWSKYNILEINMAAAKNMSFSVKNVLIEYPSYITCTADYGIIDADNNAVSNISECAGKSLRGYVSYKNAKKTDERLVLIITVYKEGRMTEFKTYAKTAATGTEGELFTDEYTVPNDTEGMSVNMLVWRSIGGLSSVGGMVSVN